MLFVYPFSFILSLNSDIDWGVREGIFHCKGDLRKNAKEFALIFIRKKKSRAG